MTQANTYLKAFKISIDFRHVGRYSVYVTNDNKGAQNEKDA